MGRQVKKLSAVLNSRNEGVLKPISDLEREQAKKTVFESGTGQTPFYRCDRMTLCRTHFPPYGVRGNDGPSLAPGWARFHWSRLNQHKVNCCYYLQV
jgi:hypothetical protein